VIVAAALVLLLRAPIDVPPAAPAHARQPALQSAASTAADVGAEARETPADAKQRELEAMSETFRNTTLLIAIRDAGFICRELLRVYGNLDDSPKWLATCSDMLAYTVGVASNGALQVAPTLQYLDGIPQPIPREFSEPAPRLQTLPPQTLPAPR
jgi:hypothetical protein